MKIKTSIFYSLAAFALMGGVANAQSSATDPVGFHTLQIIGSDANGPRYSLLSAGLVNPIEYASAATSIDSTTITVDGTPFAGLDYGTVPEAIIPGDFGDIPVPAHNAYYVEITDGPEAGCWANITANTDNTLTVDADLAAAGDTSKIAIRKHVTINDLFGAANEAGLDPGFDPDSADEVSLFANGISQVFFYDDTLNAANGNAPFGWNDASFNYVGNTPIEPQQAVYVQRKQPGNLSFTRAGHVKIGPTKLRINPGYNALANPRAVGRDDLDAPVLTLGNSGLSTGVKPGTTPEAADSVVVNEYDEGTDVIKFLAFFYDETDNGGQPYGWGDAAFADQNGYVLENGKGFLVENKGGPAAVATFTAETIAP